MPNFKSDSTAHFILGAERRLDRFCIRAHRSQFVTVEQSAVFPDALLLEECRAPRLKLDRDYRDQDDRRQDYQCPTGNYDVEKSLGSQIFL